LVVNYLSKRFAEIALFENRKHIFMKMKAYKAVDFNRHPSSEITDKGNVSTKNVKKNSLNSP